MVLVAALVLSLIDLVRPNDLLPPVTVALLGVAICLMYRQLSVTAWILVGLSLGTLAWALWTGIGVADLVMVARRVVYLPTLIVAMTLLRVALQETALVADAGAYVVFQPPGRRYALLAFGAHIFGILLNIGGYMLLCAIAFTSQETAKVSERIAAIQKRRISTALMRGFAATLFWSPFSVGLNILLPLRPGIDWVTYLPYGLAGMVVYAGLGWIVDRFENPRRARAGAAPLVVERQGRVSALLGMVGILAVIAGAGILGNALWGVQMRAALLGLVPVVAIAWVLIFSMPGAVGGVPAGLRVFRTKALAGLSANGNEVTIMTTAAMLGLLLGLIVDPGLVQGLILWTGLTDIWLAFAIAVAIFVSAFLWVPPLVATTMIVMSVTAAGIPIADALLVLAVMSGWATSMLVSPMTATMVIAATRLGLSTITVGMKWNWLFSAVFLCAIGPVFWLIWG
tara:strand:+ start:945 stop:2309 length:1365 start_codon:yes stop_codon:yes gene_type:complete